MKKTIRQLREVAVPPAPAAPPPNAFRPAEPKRQFPPVSEWGKAFRGETW